MSGTIAELGIRARSREVSTADQRLRRLAGGAARAEASTIRLRRATDGLASGMRGIVGQLAGLTSAYFSLNAVMGAAETYTHMQNRLVALGASHAQATDQIQKLVDISNRVRAPLTATSQLYTRLSLSAKSLGADQQQLMQFTETVGLALATSGTSATEASGALLQLSQAMAGGVVRTEEFNSIIEGAPGLLMSVARGIEGVDGDLGKLRQMMLDGELTSKTFFDALLSQTGQLEAAFANTTPTIAQAMTVLSNNFTTFIGEMGSSLGVTKNIAQGLLFLSENLDRVAIYAGAAAAIFGARYVVGLMAAAGAVGTLTGALRLLKVALVTSGIGILAVAAGEAIYQFTRLAQHTGSLGGAFAAMKGVVSEVWDRIKIGAQAVVQSIKALALETKASALEMGASLIEAGGAAGKMVEAVVAAFNGDWTVAWDSAKSVVQSFKAWWDGLTFENSAALTGVKTFIDDFAAAFSGSLEPALQSVKDAWAQVGPTFDNIKEAWEGILQAFGVSDGIDESATIRTISSALGSFAGIGLEVVAGVLEGIARALETLTGALAGVIAGDWNRVKTEFREFFTWLTSGLELPEWMQNFSFSQMFEGLDIANAAETIKGWFPEGWQEVMPDWLANLSFSDFFPAIDVSGAVEWFKGIWPSWEDIKPDWIDNFDFSSIFGGAEGDISVAELRANAQDVAELKADVVATQAALSELDGLSATTLGTVRALLVDVNAEVVSFASNMHQTGVQAITDLGAGMSSASGQVSGAVEGVKAQALAVMAAFAAQMEQAGRDAMQGLTRGLVSEAQAAADAAADAAQKVLDATKGTLDIRSPSREMGKLGRYASEGLAKGITDRTPEVAKAASEVADAATNAIAEGMRETAAEARTAADAAQAMANELMGAATAPLESLKGLENAVETVTKETEQAVKATEALEASTGAVAKVSREAAQGMALTSGEVRGLSRQMTDTGKALAEDAEKAGASVGNSFASAMFNFLKSGFKDVEGLVNAVLQQITSAIQSGMNSVGQAASGALGGGQGGGQGGIMGGIFGQGGFFQSFGQGFGSIFKPGGLKNLGSLFSGATSSIGGFASALGAAAGVASIAAAAISFFQTKTELLAQGIRLSVNDLDVVVESWEKIRTTRFWGLSSKTETDYDDADWRVQDVVAARVRELQAGVQSAAEALGIGAEAFEDFAFRTKVEFDGDDPDGALRALEAGLKEMTDAYALMAFDAALSARETADAVHDMRNALDVGNMGIADALDVLAQSLDEMRIGDRFKDEVLAAYAVYEQELGDLGISAAFNTNSAGLALRQLEDDLNPEPVVDAMEGAVSNATRILDALAGGVQQVRDTAQDTLIGSNRLEGLIAVAQLQGDGGAGAVETEEEVTLRTLRDLGLAKAGEGASDALERLASSLTTVNAIADTFGVSIGEAFYEIGLDGAKLASGLVDYFGDLETMQDQVNNFYTKFFSEEERLATLTRQTTEQFAALGLAMPTTREEFRDLTLEFFAMGEAGQETFAALTGMTDAVDRLIPEAEEATDAIEDLADATTELSDAERRVRTVMSAVSGLIRDAMSEVRETARDGISALTDELRGVQGRMGDAQSAITGFLDTMQTETVDGFRTMLDGITAALDARGAITAAQERARYFAAQASLQGMARTGLTDQGALDRALAGINTDSARFFSSAVDFRLDYAQTTATLRALEATAGDQLSDAERQLQTLRDQYEVQERTFATLQEAVAALQFETAQEATLLDQIDVMEQWETTQLSLLERQLEEAQTMVDAVFGLSEQFDGVTGALKALSSAVGGLSALNGNDTKPSYASTLIVSGIDPRVARTARTVEQAAAMRVGSGSSKNPSGGLPSAKRIEAQNAEIILELKRSNAKLNTLSRDQSESRKALERMDNQGVKDRT